MPELPRPLPPPTWRDRLTQLAAWRDGVPLPVLAIVVGLVAALTLGVVTLTNRNAGGKTDVALSLPRATTSDAAPSAAPTTTRPTSLHVHAAGAVVTPGVVQVPAGARVVDVVAAAGGAAPDADLNQVNLAELVTDGQRVYIPRAGETVAPIVSGGTASAASGRKDAGGIVNLNEADQAVLETLPGVGPATAQAIIDYRTQHGRFRSVDDLLNVRGIGPAKLEQIRPHARV